MTNAERSRLLALVEQFSEEADDKIRLARANMHDHPQLALILSHEAEVLKSCVDRLAALLPSVGQEESPPTDADVNAAIDRLASRAKQGVLGITGHHWGIRADIDRQAAVLKTVLATPPLPCDAPEETN